MAGDASVIGGSRTCCGRHGAVRMAAEEAQRGDPGARIRRPRVAEELTIGAASGDPWVMRLSGCRLMDRARSVRVRVEGRAGGAALHRRLHRDGRPLHHRLHRGANGQVVAAVACRERDPVGRQQHTLVHLCERDRPVAYRSGTCRGGVARRSCRVTADEHHMVVVARRVSRSSPEVAFRRHRKPARPNRTDDATEPATHDRRRRSPALGDSEVRPSARRRAEDRLSPRWQLHSLRPGRCRPLRPRGSGRAGLLSACGPLAESLLVGRSSGRRPPKRPGRSTERSTVWLVWRRRPFIRWCNVYVSREIGTSGRR